MKLICNIIITYDFQLLNLPKNKTFPKNFTPIQNPLIPDLEHAPLAGNCLAAQIITHNACHNFSRKDGITSSLTDAW